MSATLARRITAAVVTASLAAVVAASPASALRLVPPDTSREVSVAVESCEEPALLLSTGRLAAHMAGTLEKTGSGFADEDASLFMSSGRLLG
jgi:hypothetical protein